MSYKAYKTEINPTPEQKRLINRTLGVCRFVYNLFIDENEQAYLASERYVYDQEIKALKEQGVKDNDPAILALQAKKKDIPSPFISGYSFSKWLNTEYRTQNPDKVWIQEVSSKAVKQSIMNADKAFKSFFKGKTDFPKKKKNRDGQSFYMIGTPGVIRASRHQVFLPLLKNVLLKEYGYIPTDAAPTSATITKQAGRYYVSVMFADNTSPLNSSDSGEEGLGVDLGIKNFAVTSEGEVIVNINKYPLTRKANRRLKREQRGLSRKREARKKQKRRATEDQPRASNNYKKQRNKLQKAHKRVSNIRHNHVKQTVAGLVKTKPAFIVIEDLNISGMMKNKHLARAIGEQNFGYFRSLLIAEGKRNGIEIRIANRFYPSSKLCSACGFKHTNLRLKDRTFVCPECGFSIDRDLNAAINLKNCEQFQVA